jgi:hypothetical protein
MTKDEALKLALEALEDLGMKHYESTGEVLYKETFTAIKEALANEALEKMAENARELGLDYEPEQEPVAWLLTDKNINSLQVDSIQRLIDRLKHAHHTDLCVRINGQDEWFQADWLKHMVRASPPQRTWVGLTDEEILLISAECAFSHQHMDIQFARAIEAALKAKNT